MIEPLSTKDILAASLKELSETIPLSEITVSMITKNCGMSQRTFYNHFRDKDELVFWIYRSFEEALIEKLDQDYTWPNALLDTLDFFMENKKFIRNAFVNTEGYNSFRQTADRHIYDIASTVIRRHGTIWPIPENTAFQMRLYFYGATAMTYDWIVADMKRRPEEFAILLMDSMPPDVKNLLVPTDSPQQE